MRDVCWKSICGQVEMQIGSTLIAWAVGREPIVGKILFPDNFSYHLEGIDQVLVVTVRQFSDVLKC